LLSNRITFFQEVMRYFVGSVFPILHQFKSSIFII
jgi:hypothetical protein